MKLSEILKHETLRNENAPEKGKVETDMETGMTLKF